MSSNFLQWGPASSPAPVETDAQYLADPSRIGGATLDSRFSAALANKAFQQWSAMVAALGNLMASRGITNSDANLTALEAALADLIPQSAVADTTLVSVNGNTTSNQTMATYSIPAGALNAVGKAVRITAFGNFVTSGAVETIQFGFGFGAVLEIPVILPVASGVKTIPWRIVIDIVTQTTGSNGAVLVTAEVASGWAGGGTPASGDIGLPTFDAINPINLTIAQSLSWEVIFSVASSSNVGNQYGYLVEQLN